MASIAVSPIGQVVIRILVIMLVNTFKPDIIFFIGNVIMCLDVTVTGNFQY